MLSDADLDRFVKLLGVLGSEHADRGLSLTLPQLPQIKAPQQTDGSS
jgi:hypothetical protein